MNLQNRRHTLVGFVGNRPMLDFDGKQMANEATQERTLKKGLKRFAAAPENLWHAAAESASVIGKTIGVERLMVWQHTQRLVHRRAIEILLTKEMFPEQNTGPDLAPMLEEARNLKSQRRTGMGMGMQRKG